VTLAERFTLEDDWRRLCSACRAREFAFATSAGRFVGAGITFLVGAGVSHFGTPVALTSIAFAVELLLLRFGEETKGQSLPA